MRRVLEGRMFWYVMVLQLVCLFLATAFSDRILLFPAVVGLVVAGIPHGANDVLYRALTPFASLPVFLAVYLGIMGAYALLWWWLPSLALLVFLAISVHHFGQTTFESKHWYHPLAIIWGVLFLAFPVVLHHEVAFGIFSEMVGDTLTLPNAQVLKIVALSSLVGFLFLVWIKETKQMFFRVLVQWSVLLPFLYVAPLIEGFLLAFVLWHAVPSMIQQWRFYKSNNPTGSTVFTRTMVVYTAVSALFLLILYAVIDLTPAVLFILLSLITLPHALVIHKTLEAGD